MKRGHQGYVAVGLPVSAETRDPSRLTEQAFEHIVKNFSPDRT